VSRARALAPDPGRHARTVAYVTATRARRAGRTSERRNRRQTDPGNRGDRPAWALRRHVRDGGL